MLLSAMRSLLVNGEKGDADFEPRIEVPWPDQPNPEWIIRFDVCLVPNDSAEYVPLWCSRRLDSIVAASNGNSSAARKPRSALFTQAFARFVK